MPLPLSEKSKPLEKIISRGMGFSSVYESLQEIFPEADPRLLRAVAIEHPKDADLAVEVVLTEVLPYMSKHSDSSSSQSENMCSRDPLNEGVGYAEEDMEPHNSLIRRRILRSAPIEDASSADLIDGANNADPTSPDKSLTNYVVLDENDKLISFGEVEERNDNVGLDHGASVDQQVSNNIESEKPSNIEFGAEETANVNETASVHEVEDAAKLNNLNLEDFDGPDAHDFGSQPAENYVFTQIPSSVEDTPDAPESGLPLNSGSSVSDCEMGDLCLNSNQDYSDSELVDIEDDSALLSRSRQICSVDSLEEIVEDAKNKKKALVSAKESVINMIKEVELQEMAAEQAKEEASKGVFDILLKVEELKKMLVHAKEANDMHTGEVYGEKAILATEVRELQSRLLSLSHEQDISLAILNDMRETLESRMSSAEEVMRVALLEKQAKEESAQKELAEQEAIMEKVVQESKILQQEAEENSKLQEFLMDRGHAVDMLQGELSTICHDVRSLKEKFDKRVPLSQSLTLSKATFISASLSSSLKSVASDLDIDQGLSKTPNKTSPTTSVTNGESPKSSTTSIINGESPKSLHGDRIGDNYKVLLNDEWFLCENTETI